MVPIANNHSSGVYMDENKYIDIRRKNVFSQKTKFSFVQFYSSAIDKGMARLPASRERLARFPLET